MELIKGSMIISTKDIQIITGKTYNKANKEHVAVRDALGKDKQNYKLSIKEYCDYFQLDYDEVVRHLNAYR